MKLEKGSLTVRINKQIISNFNYPGRYLDNIW